MNNMEVPESRVENAGSSYINSIIRLIKFIPTKYRPWFVVLLIFVISPSLPMKTSYLGIKNIVNKSNNTNYSKTEEDIQKCLSDSMCHTSILNERLGLFVVEKLVFNLDLKYSEKSVVDEEKSYLERNSIVLEKTILNKYGFFHEKDSSISVDNNTISPKAAESIAIENTELALDTSEKVIIEFADDSQIQKGNAATCNPGKFYEKRLELLNTNSGKIVEVVK